MRADIIINRWQTMEIFEGVHEISPQFAQNDILDLADEIAKLRAEVARLTAELAAARELLAEIEFRASNNYPIESIKETARQIDDHLYDVGYRK